MPQILAVTVSGSVGKQALPITGKFRKLCGYSLVGSGKVTMKIRDGASSGSVVWEDAGISAKTYNFEDYPLEFAKGMHVKVIGTGGTAYLELE